MKKIPYTDGGAAAPLGLWGRLGLASAISPTAESDKPHRRMLQAVITPTSSHYTVTARKAIFLFFLNNSTNI